MCNVGQNHLTTSGLKASIYFKFTFPTDMMLFGIFVEAPGRENDEAWFKAVITQNAACMKT